MTGGQLKIEVLPAGAVVKAFDLIDAVRKGTLDGGHGVLVYWLRQEHALALWGSGPAFGMDANMLLAWHKYGGGKELLANIYNCLNLNVVSFPYGPMPRSRSAGTRSRLPEVDDFKGLKFRTVGFWIEMFTAMGAAVNALPGAEIVPALDRGLIDAAEFNNPSSDRALGFPDVSKVYMMQSFHQSAEQFEILFNKTKYDALSDKLEEHHRERRRSGIRRHVLEGDRPVFAGLHRSPGGEQGQGLQDARFRPAGATQDLGRDDRKEVCRESLVQESARLSQKTFAERTTRWQYDQNVDFRIAVNHYFGKKA